MFRNAYVFLAFGVVLALSPVNATELLQKRTVLTPLPTAESSDRTQSSSNEVLDGEWQPCPDNPNELCIIEEVIETTTESSESEQGRSGQRNNGGGGSGAYEVIQIVEEDGSSSGGSGYSSGGSGYETYNSEQVFSDGQVIDGGQGAYYPDGSVVPPAEDTFTIDTPRTGGIYALVEAGYPIANIATLKTATAGSDTSSELTPDVKGNKLGGVTLGARAGYNFGLFRADVGYDYQSVKFNTTEGTGETNYEGEVDSHLGTAMVGVRYDLDLFTLYAGGGGGVAYNQMSDIARSSGTTAQGTVKGADKIGYTARGQAGAAINFDDNISIQLGYRYNWFSEMESDNKQLATSGATATTDLTNPLKLNLQNHSVVGGVEIGF